LTESEPVSENIFRPYPGAVAIYLHFPFCTNRCNYCDFFKEPYQAEMAENVFRAIRYETEMVFLAMGREPIDIASIYIGGGTPSLIRPKLLEEWIGVVKSYSRFLPGYEFTVEANPESLTDEFAERSYRAGVNRIVIGVQSFSTQSLRRLGRRQTTRQIYRAFYRARSAGYENIGADLIFGLPDQTMRKVRTDIDRLAALDPTHISYYQLTVEQGTTLAEQVASGEIVLPGEETLASMYQIGVHMLGDYGYQRYEVSNFAQDGYRSRHNYAYWNGSPYIGLGPGAHGFVNNRRYADIMDIERYIKAIESGILPIGFIEELTGHQRMMEMVMLSLRTADGIDKQSLVLHFGEPAVMLLESPAVARHVGGGYLHDGPGFLRLTDAGFLVADKIIADLTGGDV
jgi:oxygen-independent coproporphyrinogen-3 oxidase